VPGASDSVFFPVRLTRCPQEKLKAHFATLYNIVHFRRKVNLL